MLRLTALLTAALLGLGLAGPPASAAAPAVTASARSVASTAPGLTWGACADRELRFSGLQCSTLAVPLDHADPTGPQITLALSRRAHTGSSFQGAMLVNPGGPGGSGLSLAAIGDYVPGGAGAAYDWIGFDPRGVGASVPSLHCTQTYFGVNRPSYVPRTPAATSYWLRKSKAYADACANSAPKRALLQHLTTLDTVRDMELIRQALGVETLGYYGYSYGTYLGQVYATRYPDRVGRFVLDGVVNPYRTWYAANLDQDRAFNANLDTFWQYVAQHDRSFHLGRRWTSIRRGYYRQLRTLDRHAAAGGRLGPAELTDAMTDAGYYVFNWPEIAGAYSQLVRRHRGSALFGLYRAAQMGDDNSFAVYNAVECSDVAWPTWTQTRADSWKTYAGSPFLTWSNTWFNSPCMYWHSAHGSRLGVSGSAVSSKMLLISETRDAATPYSGALTVRSLFPTASLVAGVGGTTHSSSLSGVACVDNTVAAYLRDGTVPGRLSGSRADRSCPRVAPPSPGGSGARTGGARTTDPLPAGLRHDLLAAQAYVG